MLIISLNKYNRKKSTSFRADINQVIIHHMCLSFPINYVRLKCKFFLQFSWNSPINIIQSVLVWRWKYHIELNIIILIPFVNTRENFQRFHSDFYFHEKIIYLSLNRSKQTWKNVCIPQIFFLLFSSFLPVSVNLPTKRERENERKIPGILLDVSLMKYIFILQSY